MNRELKPPVTVKQLAEIIHKSPEEILNFLSTMGWRPGAHEELKTEQAIWIIEKEGFRIKVQVRGKEKGIAVEPEKNSAIQTRPPVVTVMGHVDHGKTVLLDAIRHTKLANHEPGAITQHIGAYKIHLPKGDIVFLDTPGHEAFAVMRARGAVITDIIILVVAADEGVRAQTVEAIQHAQSANVPIIVAVNKIDLPRANTQRIREELAQYNIIPEEWQGDTIYVNISGKYKKNLDQLLEMILLLAEMMELKSHPHRSAQGTVIESKIDKRFGPVATVLVQDGSLRLRDHFVCGRTFGRVRFMTDDMGKQLKEVPPSTPVQISYFSELPRAGDPFFCLPGEKEAKRLAELIAGQYPVQVKEKPGYLKREDLQKEILKGEVSQLSIVLKVDVFGSLQPVIQSLENIKIPGTKIEVIHSGVGMITESDVLFAKISQGFIVGFNVVTDRKAVLLAKEEKVDIRLYNVIYELIDDVAKLAKGMLIPHYEEQIIGKGEVIRVFHIPDIGTVPGCLVQEGKFIKGYEARVIRKGIVLYTGEIISLKHYDEFVKEIAEGNTCGIMLSGGFKRYRTKDQIEVFVRREIPVR